MSDAPPALKPIPLPGLDRIAPYTPGDSHLDGRADVIKLSSNESALGCSEAARQAYIDAAARLHLYPDGGATALREAIGKLHGIDPARIVCGAGSDELLHLVAAGYVEAGDEIVYPEHGFMVYPLIARQARAKGIAAPETDGLVADVDAILARVTPRTKIVFLDNPSNPKGTVLPASEVRRLYAGLPASTILALDAAYAEFVTGDDYESGLELAGSAPNVVTMRTFSKIYGLAGVRIGWLYGPPEIVDVVHRLRSPFNVSAPAIAAGVAALGDQDFVARAVAHNAAERTRVEAAAERLGILAVRGVSNFTLLRFPSVPGKTCKEADAFLRQRGIILRGMTGYGLPDCLRATVGTVEQNGLLIAALEDFMGRQANVGRL